MILFTFFSLGNLIASPPSLTYAPDVVYAVHSRCEEILPRNNYILSMGNTKFYLSSYDTDTTYRVGDSLRFSASIRPLRVVSNPGEFSYPHYLQQKNVHHQLLPHTVLQHTGHSRHLLSVFGRFREELLKKNERLIADTTCRMLVDALCLGYQNNLDGELKNLFLTTGTIHLLSVSGLHTGAIYWLFITLLSFLGLHGRRKELLVLPLLWGYACLTGLSPSVVRAANILTFITIGKTLQRNNTPMNSLAASAFLALVIEPHTLYSLSFLLSYSAYTGILTLYPLLYRPSKRLPRLISWAYACICITIAAQLPTLPISAYYFHTINLNGFIANLFAIPLSTVLLYCSVICLALPVCVAEFLVFIPEMTFQLLIGFLKLFAPYSVNLKELYPSLLTTIGLYICLFSFLHGVSAHKKKQLGVFVFALIGLFIWQVGENLYLSSRQELIVFHYYKQSGILLNNHGYGITLKNTTQDSVKTQPYIWQNKLQTIKSTGVSTRNVFWNPPFLYLSTDTILIADPKSFMDKPYNILIISDNLLPRQVPLSPTLREVILDGSNHKFTLREWLHLCHEKGVTLRTTTEEGAIRISYKE